MASYTISGGTPLKGKIRSAANKNAILPAMVACILTEETCILENVPKIRDVIVMGNILKSLGITIEGIGTNKLIICAKKITNSSIDVKLASELRASVLLLGPLLARFKSATLPHPGGDIIGKRSIDSHINGLIKLGAVIKKEDLLYKANTGSLVGDRIFLDETSVTATENIMMAASLAKGTTIIKNCASEPHVVCLANLLNEMGACIEGAGTSVIKIKGTGKLHGAKHKIRPDHIEAGTWAIAAAATGGEIEIEEVIPNDVDMILMYLSKMGISFKWKNNIKNEQDYEKVNNLIVKKSNIVATNKIDANIWPAFPTDLISPMIVLATQASGSTLIHDWMYEGRMFFVDKLIKMGANIIISDPHRVVVAGPTKLSGREITSPDIRAGMALVIAALCAKGKSTIHKVELIERGYEEVEKRLQSLGAKINKIE